MPIQGIAVPLVSSPQCFLCVLDLWQLAKYPELGRDCGFSNTRSQLRVGVRSLACVFSAGDDSSVYLDGPRPSGHLSLKLSSSIESNARAVGAANPARDSRRTETIKAVPVS